MTQHVFWLKSLLTLHNCLCKRPVMTPVLPYQSVFCLPVIQTPRFQRGNRISSLLWESSPSEHLGLIMFGLIPSTSCNRHSTTHAPPTPLTIGYWLFHIPQCLLYFIIVINKIQMFLPHLLSASPPLSWLVKPGCDRPNRSCDSEVTE